MRGDPQAEMLSDVSDKILVAGDDKSPPPGATRPNSHQFLSCILSADRCSLKQGKQRGRSNPKLTTFQSTLILIISLYFYPIYIFTVFWRLIKSVELDDEMQIQRIVGKLITNKITRARTLFILQVVESIKLSVVQAGETNSNQATNPVGGGAAQYQSLLRT